MLVLLGWRVAREQVKYGFAVPSTRQFWLRNVLIIVGIMFIAYRLAGYKGLPMVALIAFILIGVYMFLTLRTVIGRRIYAVGGNAKAAMLSGVNSKRMVFLTFINMGVLAALGGMIIAARLQLRDAEGRATASSSTSSRRRSSAARPPTAASARSPARSSAPCSSGC